jgi:hypothetical protein
MKWKEYHNREEGGRWRDFHQKVAKRDRRSSSSLFHYHCHHNPAFSFSHMHSVFSIYFLSFQSISILALSPNSYSICISFFCAYAVSESERVMIISARNECGLCVAMSLMCRNGDAVCVQMQLHDGAAAALG